jgi:hypothetical protein
MAKIENIKQPWFMEYPTRWEFELEILEKIFPGIKHTICGNRIDLRIRILQSSANGRWIRLNISPDYPKVVPKVFLEDLHFRFGKHRLERAFGITMPRPPHLYDDNSLCLFYPNDPSEKRWMPDDGIIQIVWWAEEWMKAYYHWIFTRQWLGEEAPH